MKAIVQDVYGSADVLQFRDIDRPSPGDGEILIQVRAAGADPGAKCSESAAAAHLPSTRWRGRTG